MRAGLSTIQQTLTPEAASVLNHSISEASRRNHGQTTPLHVAATLLASPSGFLRQACIKSHPNSSHPLQCRALELCFSVALERLPTAQNASPGVDPPISNALMAALKRAQAHQRRGCPEQQQQPLLAVKVELEQLIISILDDPSVSRVMREASFSSPAVKATIEQSLNSNSSISGNNNNNSSSTNSSSIGLGFRQLGRNLYMNPRLQQQQGSGIQSGQQRNEEIKRVIDIFLRNKKRNPVLVGESEPEMVVKEIIAKIEGKELEGVLKNIEVIRLNKEFLSSKSEIVSKLRELGGVIEGKIGNNSNGVVVDMGDLKWLVEQQQVGLGSSAGNSGAAAVAEMGKMVVRFGGGGSGGGKLWLIGTATCETYLRCQVYHPSMENDWDLQAVPIAAKSPLPGLFPRLGSNGILGTSLQSLSPLKAFNPDPAVAMAAMTVPQRRVPENSDPTRRTSCCPQCAQNCEQELATLKDMEKAKSSSGLKPDAAKSPLPQWLQTAAVDQTPSNKDDDLLWKQKSQELQKKWTDTCLRLHPSFHHSPEKGLPTSLPMTTSLYNPTLLNRQPFHPKLQLNKINLGESLRLNNPIQGPTQLSERVVSPPNSPVRTELVLGRSKINESGNSPEKVTRNDRVRDFLGCMNSEPQNKTVNAVVDADSFKRLLKGLAEKVWWQGDAASAVATVVTQCKLGNGKRRGGGSKGDMWLLFTGPDRVGKKKMVTTLSELICGSQPVMISLGSLRLENGGESDVTHFRGKTALDRIVEAVRRNPFSVILLEDIDEADMLVRGSIKRAMERGRLTDSHGREISLGNVIFILTANWLPDSLKFLSQGINLDDQKLAKLVNDNWQLKLSISGKTAKRRASWLHDEERTMKSRKENSSSLSFDLNKAADFGDDNKADGSLNSSDLTIDHDDQENGLSNRMLLSPPTSTPSKEMVDSVDGTIVFKPVDFGPIRRDITNSITKKFISIIGNALSIEIHDEALERLVGGVWLGRTSLDEWTEKVLVPSFHQLKSRLPSNAILALDESAAVIVRLESDTEKCIGTKGDLLPSNIKIVADEF